MSKSRKDNTVGPWAEQKLDALERYLEFYCKVMQKKKYHLVYVDAFAGVPRSKVRRRSTSSPEELMFDFDKDTAKEQVKFIEGSPLRALKFGFHKFHFFDLDKSRVSTLNDACKGRNDVVIENGDCNLLIDNILQSLGHPRTRGVAFLDPYGPHLHWATVDKLARTGNMEVIINFPVAMAINRLIKKDVSKIDSSCVCKLDNCFGTHEWYEKSYITFTDMLGHEKIKKLAEAQEALRDLYIGRLKKMFRYVEGPRLIHNTRGAPLYYLIWAGQNHVGAKGAKYIFDQRKIVSSAKNKVSSKRKTQLQLDLSGKQ